MPSIFSLFGELGLKSDQLEAGLKRADARLQSTDANLNKVISTSNKLGDTSATVARRYEKIGEGIETQRQRILATVQAFQKGDISAKQFGNTLASVETKVASLNSRLKDAAARATELGETGFTHFQNQIRGGVTEPQHSLINLNSARPLQGLGPVLQGLGARQFGLDETILNILIVAARQAGIIKVAQVATAAAATEAAVAETAFSAAAKSAATSQAVVAAESEATAAAMTEASAVTTVFGATLLSLGSVLAAGAVAILAAKKLSEDILKSAQDRLKLEESIAAAMNAQNLAAAKLNEERAKAQGDRQFNTYLQNAPLGSLQVQRDNLQRQLNEDQRQSAAERERLSNLASALGPYTGTQFANQAKAVGDAAAARLKQTGEQLKDFDAKIYEREQESATKLKALHDQLYGQQTESFQQFTERIKNNYKQQEEAAKQASEASKKMAVDAIKKAQEYVEQVKKAKAAILDTLISTTDDPYAKIFDQRLKAIDKLREAAKGLNIDLSAPLAAIDRKYQTDKFKLQIDDKLQAFNYRDLARQFRAGKLDENTPENFQKNLDARLKLIGGGNAAGIQADWLNWIGQRIQKPITALDAAQQHIRDQAIISAVGNDPSKLNANERQIAAGAFDREAKKAADREKNEADKLLTEKELVTQLKVLNENGGMKLVIENNAPDNAKVSTRPKGTATTNYYLKN